MRAQKKVAILTVLFLALLLSPLVIYVATRPATLKDPGAVRWMKLPAPDVKPAAGGGVGIGGVLSIAGVSPAERTRGFPPVLTVRLRIDSQDSGANWAMSRICDAYYGQGVRVFELSMTRDGVTSDISSCLRDYASVRPEASRGMYAKTNPSQTSVTWSADVQSRAHVVTEAECEVYWDKVPVADSYTLRLSPTLTADVNIAAALQISGLKVDLAGFEGKRP